MPSHTSTHQNRPAGTNSFRCRVCRGIHPLRKCQRFLRLAAEKRLRAVLINKYCSNCLAHQHSGQSCRSAGSCRVCHGDHHTLLHFKEARGARPNRQRRGDDQPGLTRSRTPTRPRFRAQARPHSRTPARSGSRSLSPPSTDLTYARGAFPTSFASLLQDKAVSILPTANILIDTGCKTFEMRALIDPCTATSRISASLATA
ncbi:uncharacterized protein LOC133837564 [Drosophila sulfurigaster albostrigata]|uniref:uncharacterized protein LOC133837564 n=1 Tax=Drosophila sulfurigaster albostrigata TaxID=89887 RepID=UPI002D21BA86|nr:uncharacterized protein LOC133837564 [Drosophila sulfurigaster albostrigata]